MSARLSLIAAGAWLALGAPPLAAQASGPGGAATAVAVPAVFIALSDMTMSALAKPQFAGLNELEQKVVSGLVVYAAMMVDSGWCQDRSASGNAAETYLFTFGGLGRRSPALRPIFELPTERKTQLVDAALAVESQRGDPEDLREEICKGRLLDPGKVPALAERRASARQVLTLGLTTPPQPPAAGAP